MPSAIRAVGRFLPCRLAPARPLVVAAVGLLLVPPLLAAQEQRVATSDVTGRVIERDTGAPIEAVDVALVDLNRRTVTTDEGRFLFRDVPVGTHTLQVRHLGFSSEEREITVRAPFELSLTLRLQPEPVELEPLVAEVENELRVKYLEDEGFYRRRARDRGEFLGPRYLTRWRGTRVPTMLRRIPGLAVHRVGIQGRRFAANATICVDEIPWRKVPDFPTSMVAGIEYNSEFGALCDLQIWTWQGPNPMNHVDLSEAGCPLPAYRSEAC